LARVFAAAVSMYALCAYSASTILSNLISITRHSLLRKPLFIPSV
jgi:hypothetical protein